MCVAGEEISGVTSCDISGETLEGIHGKTSRRRREGFLEKLCKQFTLFLKELQKKL